VFWPILSLFKKLKNNNWQTSTENWACGKVLKTFRSSSTFQVVLKFILVHSFESCEWKQSAI